MKRINGQLVIFPDGVMNIRTTNGAFSEGSGLIGEIAAKMREQGVGLPPLEVERHIHGDEDNAHVHVHSAQREIV